MNAIKQKNSALTKFGILGVCFTRQPPPKKEHKLTGLKIQYCWGGKAVALTVNSASNPFSAAASVHPAMVDAADATSIKVPFMMLASGDEPADDVKKFEDALTVPKHVERFDDQIHGWMAARSDLSNDRVKAEYERGYKTLLKFFSQHV